MNMHILTKVFKDTKW